MRKFILSTLTLVSIYKYIFVLVFYTSFTVSHLLTTIEKSSSLRKSEFNDLIQFHCSKLRMKENFRLKNNSGGIKELTGDFSKAFNKPSNDK